MVHVNGTSEQRQANFRTESPQHVVGVGGQQPQTGLSVLMNNSVAGANPPPLALPTAATNVQRAAVADQEQQASSLAAAGMVAESVRLAQPNAALQPPPQLATSGPAHPPASLKEIDSINWNMMDTGAHNLDDMDLDFAQLFDPVNELANMHAEGNGWPASPPAATAAGPTVPNGPLAPSPLGTTMNRTGEPGSSTTAANNSG